MRTYSPHIATDQQAISVPEASAVTALRRRWTRTTWNVRSFSDPITQCAKLSLACMAVKAKPGIFRHEQSLVCDLAAKYGVAQAASASAPDSAQPWP